MIGNTNLETQLLKNLFSKLFAAITKALVRLPKTFQLGNLLYPPIK